MTYNFVILVCVGKEIFFVINVETKGIPLPAQAGLFVRNDNALVRRS